MRRKLHDAGACRAMAADVERESDRLLVDLVGAATDRTTSSEELNSPHLTQPKPSQRISAPCRRCDIGWLLAMPPGRALRLDGAEARGNLADTEAALLAALFDVPRGSCNHVAEETQALVLGRVCCHHLYVTAPSGAAFQSHMRWRAARHGPASPEKPTCTQVRLLRGWAPRNCNIN